MGEVGGSLTDIVANEGVLLFIWPCSCLSTMFGAFLPASSPNIVFILLTGSDWEYFWISIYLCYVGYTANVIKFGFK